MLPTKRVQLNFANEDYVSKYSPMTDDISEDYDNPELENKNEGKKQRKRRTLSETSKRDFVCGCGKSYVSYPAIYLHVQRKHNSEWPKDTVIPERSSEQEKIKRGRPKRDPCLQPQVQVNPEEDEKLRAEDSFWLFLGLKGQQSNAKAENKFMNNVESQTISPFEVFFPQEIFENETIYNKILTVIQTITSEYTNNQNSYNQFFNTTPKTFKSADEKLSYFMLWISTPLNAEIYFEIAVILCLLRTAILTSLWYAGQKSLINIKMESIEVKLSPWTLLVKSSKADVERMHSLTTAGVCPLLGPKWNEVRKSSNGKILDQILSYAANEKTIDAQFGNMIKEIAEDKNDIVGKIAEAILNLKETELKEAVKTKRKFAFLNWTTLADLKEFIQKTCEWMVVFNPDEYSLHDVDIPFPK